MSASKPPASRARASDGFATLTADMMERRGATPPPLVNPGPGDDPKTERAQVEARQATSGANSAFGKRTKPKGAPKRTKRAGNPAQAVIKSAAGAAKPTGINACQTAGQAIQKDYSGPERRKRDVSPVVERRRSVPPRVKVSVRLEQHRHHRLKGAGILLGRTHQDIMTVALDRYLDDLGILNGPDR